MPLDAQMLDDLIDRIVNTVRPIKIVLFGSAARGQLRPDSDLDVMVVVPDGMHCLNTAGQLYERLLGFGLPVDILVATPRILERHKDNTGLIYRTILTEGKEIYVA